MIRRLMLVALMFGAATVSNAQEDRSSLWPDVPAATGAPHPEGNEYWRRNHMTLMQHDRDLTVRDGIRQVEASLKGCFDCHAATDAERNIVTYESDKHFCRSCHDFVAVKIDCFMCHRSTPADVNEDKIEHASVLPKRQNPADFANLVAYLKHTKPGNRPEAGQ